MAIRRQVMAILALLAAIVAARADSIVFVPGYGGSGWRETGVASALIAQGWTDGGHLAAAPHGIVAPPLAATPRRFYTIDLPTEAPIAEQARLLAAYLAVVRQRHPDEPVALVGHSAGGIVARYYLVVSRDQAVNALITIASPHRGSAVAGLASAVSRSPAAWAAPFVGAGTLNRSRALFTDLGHDGPATLLGWLNHQPHPPALYAALIRGGGDAVSEAWQQDLRHVPALGSAARAIVTPAGHGLMAGDGALIAGLLFGGPASPVR